MHHTPTPSDRPDGGQWFQEWFNHPFYLRLYSHRDRPEAARCVATVLRLAGFGVPPKEGLRVFDIACGAGRHALELARLGCRVTANDLSPYLLEQADEAARNEGLPLELTCRDMRRIDESSAYGMVVQLFTSFGYFDDPEDDLTVLKAVERALEPGGWYALDLLNPRHLEKTLVPHSERRVGDLSVDERRSIEDGRVSKTITITADSGEQLSFTESVKLFEPETIEAMLIETGFELRRKGGSYEGEAFDPENSPRLILISQKRQYAARRALTA